MIARLKRLFARQALGLAVASGLAILACDFFRLEGFMFFTPFLWIFIVGAVWIVFSVACCMALLHGILFIKDKRMNSLYPLHACCIFFVAYWFLPVDLYRIDMLFALNKQEMQACADKIISRELRINYTTVDSMGVRLPKSLAHLSRGDIVYVEKKKYRTIVYFVVFS